mgnify:CR=1 FL=1
MPLLQITSLKKASIAPDGTTDTVGNIVDFALAESGEGGDAHMILLMIVFRRCWRVSALAMCWPIRRC